MNEKELSKLKKLLGKVNLLRWTKRYTADNLSTKYEDLTKSLGIETDEDSVMLMDNSLVKALITDSRYVGDIHSSYDLAQLREILALLVKDKNTSGNLIITGDKQKPLVIEYGSDTIILSPKIDTDRVVKVKKEKKKKDKKEGKEDKQEEKVEEFDDEDF